MADAWRSGARDGSERPPLQRGEHNAPGEDNPGPSEAPSPAPKASGEVGAPPPIVPGNVGSLDDVPADVAGSAVAEGEG